MQRKLPWKEAMKRRVVVHVVPTIAAKSDIGHEAEDI